MNIYKTQFGLMNYCLCLDEDDEADLIAEFGLAKEDFENRSGKADALYFESDSHTPISIVRVHDVTGLYDAEIIGLLVHECTHVKQYFAEAIGEEILSPETEAYTLQEMFVNICNDYFQRMGYRLIN